MGDNIVKSEVLKDKMKNNLVEPPPEYEEMIDKLEEQITRLFSELHYYQALLTEKENTIIKLTAQNSQLKIQVQNLSHQLTLKSISAQESYLTPVPKRPMESYSPPPSQESYTPPTPKQYTVPIVSKADNTRIMKRQCPECGAMGFAIKEVDDRTKVISYSPQKIYAKKMVCTKCRTEFS
jgi:chromosome segregation ATPase